MKYLLLKDVPVDWREFVRLRRIYRASLFAYIPVSMLMMITYAPLTFLWFVCDMYYIYTIRRKILNLTCPNCGNHFFSGDGWSNEYQRVCLVCRFRRPV